MWIRAHGASMKGKEVGLWGFVLRFCDLDR